MQTFARKKRLRSHYGPTYHAYTLLYSWNEMLRQLSLNQDFSIKSYLSTSPNQFKRKIKNKSFILT